MDISFRNLVKEDFENVRKLALKGWYFSYSHLNKSELKKLVDTYYSDETLYIALEDMKTGKQFFVLAQDKNELLGFCNVSAKEGNGELLRLYIEPELIGKGLGKKLLDLGEDYLIKKGIEKYFTYVNKHNKIGYEFYLRNGFIRLHEKDMNDEFESKALWYIEKTI